MKGFCAFISLFSCCFCLVLGQVVACPAGAPSGCECSNILDGMKVECKDESTIEKIPSWIPNNTKFLEFENCNIRFLGQDSFKNLVNLTGVKILKQSDRLTFNDSSVFQGLNRLLGVSFESTDIASLPAGLFANLPRLKTVSLNSNNLATLPDDLLENSTNVQYFFIANTKLDKDVIAKIGEGHFGKNIQSLQIFGTYIQHLKDGLFSGLTKLIHLAIADCGIETIGTDVFKGTQVAVLALDNNPIKSINEYAFRDSKVSTFQCKDCNLTSNVTFSGFLKKMKQLSRINLQNNKLTHVPKNAFNGLRELSIIDLSSNLIATIEDNPFANAILPKCVTATCVQLHNNPLNCDCHLAWLRSFADEIKGDDKKLWQCGQPQNVTGKSLVSLKIYQFCCGNVNSTMTCGSPNPDPNNGWVVSAHIMVAILSQILVIFGVPSLFA